jgi:hypothetical protein
LYYDESEEFMSDRREDQSATADTPIHGSSEPDSAEDRAANEKPGGQRPTGVPLPPGTLGEPAEVTGLPHVAAIDIDPRVYGTGPDFGASAGDEGSGEEL